MTALLFALLVSASPSQVGRTGPQCVTEYGKTACGWQCLARHGQVRCAQTAVGVCYLEGDEVVCWDPRGYWPVELTDRTPRPTCVKEYGETACGWGCLARHGQLACAQTPDGICRLHDGKVVCWDPPANLRVLYRGAPSPAPSCVESYGKLACGWSCLARDGELACAQTPEGLCRQEDDHVVCWDPAL